jgi:hypothetical protein
MLSVMCADMGDPRKARRYALLLGEGEKYPRLMARYQETVVQPRRELMRSVIRRGIATGELRPDVDVEIAMLALTGTVLAKGREADGGMDQQMAGRIVDELLLGLAAR